MFWCLWYLNFSGRMILAPVLPLIEDELALSHAGAGSLFLLRSLGFSLTLIFSGFIASRLGLKRAVIAGFILLAGALYSFMYADSYSLLGISLFFLGLGSGIYLPCAIPLITSIFQKENWGKAIAFHESAASISILSVPLFVAFALPYLQWRDFFALLAAGCMAAVIIFWIFAPRQPSDAKKSSMLLAVLRQKNFWIIAALWTCMAVSSGGLSSIIPLFLVTERGMELRFANRIFGISRIGSLFTTLLIGFALDRYRVRNIMAFILLATGLSTIALAMAENFWILSAMLLIQATVCFSFFPVTLTAIAKLTEPDARSSFTGATVGLSTVFGVGLSPFILGAIADAWNFQVGIFIAGLLVSLSCLILRYLEDI
jgi:predicted MFS family arabinose efflux permease